LIYHFDKFYTLKNDYFLIERRVKGNAKAAGMIITAKKVSDLLIRFPYVRGSLFRGRFQKISPMKILISTCLLLLPKTSFG